MVAPSELGFAEALIEAIVDADEARAVAALRGATEPDRAAFAAHLVPAAAAADGFGHFVRAEDGTLEWSKRSGVANDLDSRMELAQPPVVNLAVIGTATPKQMRSLAWSISWVGDEAAAAVLLDRRPGWLQSWAQWLLTTQTMEVRWPLVRSLVRAGAIQRPPAYTRALLTRRWDRGELATVLAADPEFWRHPRGTQLRRPAPRRPGRG